MALTANRELSRYVDQELRSFPVAAGANVRKGALVGVQRSTGFVRGLVAGDVFAGIAYEEMNNTAGASGGEKSVRLYTQGDFILPANNAAMGLVGAPAYAIDDETTSLVTTGGASYCGTLIGVVGSNLGVIRIMSLAAPQIERSLIAPLASSTSGATVNPVLITQRAIKVVSLHVSFNTVPNQGNLDVGTDNSNPNQLVNAFNLATLTAHTPAELTPFGRDVAKNLRIWARVGQASTTAGVGGMLCVRYYELP